MIDQLGEEEQLGGVLANFGAVSLIEFLFDGGRRDPAGGTKMLQRDNWIERRSSELDVAGSIPAGRINFANSKSHLPA